MSFLSSKGNILCRLIKIELYKIFAIINRAIKGLHCMNVSWLNELSSSVRALRMQGKHTYLPNYSFMVAQNIKVLVSVESLNILQ